MKIFERTKKGQTANILNLLVVVILIIAVICSHLGKVFLIGEY